MRTPETPSESRRSTWLALSVYQLLANNRGGLFVVYMPIFLVVDRGASDVLALVLVAAGYVGASLTGPLSGRWSDRTGRRKAFLLAGEVGSLPLFLAIPFLPGAWGAGIGFIAAEVMLSVSAPALNAFVADQSRPTGRGRSYGILNASAAWGGLIGFVAAVLLIGPFGLTVLFYFVVAVMGGTISVVLFAVPDLRAPPRPASAAPMRYGPLAIFSTSVSIRSLGAGAVGTFYGVYAISLGATETDVGLIAIVGLLAAALLSISIGRYIDRIGEIRGVLAGGIVMLAGIAFFLFARNWTWFVPGQALRQVGFAFLGPSMLSFVAGIAPPGRRAEYLGIFGLINSTMWSLGSLAGAAAIELGGPGALFLFAMATTLLSLGLVAGVYRDRLRPKGVPAVRITAAPGAPAAGALSGPTGPGAPAEPPLTTSR